MDNLKVVEGEFLTQFFFVASSYFSLFFQLNNLIMRDFQQRLTGKELSNVNAKFKPMFYFLKYQVVHSEFSNFYV